MHTRTKWLVLSAIATMSAALVHCVADEPASSVSLEDGGGEGGVGDSGPGDSSSNTDAGSGLCATSTISCNGVSPCIVQVEGGGQNFCARDSNCNIYCWGANNAGQLGRDPTTTPFSAVPLLVDLGGDLAVGFDVGGAASYPDQTVVCARVTPTTTGTVTIKCWGANSLGQLGVSDAGPGVDDEGGAMSTTPIAVPGLNGVGLIVTGARHECAVMGAQLDCWGDNQFGQLQRETSGLFDPTPAPGTGIPGAAVGGAVGVGFQHTCIVNASGHVACEGRNEVDQLGTDAGSDAYDDASIGIVPSLANVAGIATEGNASCALQSTGVIQCWGDNEHGQLGNGVISGGGIATVGTPIGLPVGSAGTITAGYRHFCAAYAADSLSDGGFSPNLYCWGGNESGQSGQPSDGGDVPVPTKVSGLPNQRINRLAGAAQATCALFDDGTVWCWGENYVGELGNRGAGGNDGALLGPGQVTF